MIRTGFIKLLMWGIIPLTLTLVSFVTADYEKNEFWVSLCFIWLAYFTVSITCLSKWGKQLSVLNWTLYLCAAGYFVSELVVAIMFVYVYADNPQWAFAIQLLLLVAYLIVFGVVYISNHKTDKQLQEFRVNDSRIKHWRAQVAVMQSRKPSEELKVLSYLLSATPIISTQEVNSIDDEITMMIESGTPNIALVISKIKERNIILKAHTL